MTGHSEAGSQGIRLTCGRCGASWERGEGGERRCASCGGRELTNRAQTMRRHSRCTQLSIVGWRDVVLCVRCDAGVLESVGTGQRPIPEEYVSSALVDSHAPAPPRPAVPRGQASAPYAARDDPPRSSQRTAAPRPPSTQPAPPPPAPRPPSTVRQALQEPQTALASAGTTLDPTTVLLLGTGRASTAARHTLTPLAEHWLAQGWTTTDLAARLRPQEDA
ncbi:hypothetical protein [Ornithinimicrobium sp. LYQ103]|uniref:hypothetical protein n=1 Tax=Ornithinimicrobium sp. LYQ103 TaxID=3378796 RepID=UPI0038527258